MNEEIMVAQKCNRRRAVKILCCVLVCLLCFFLGAGLTIGGMHLFKGEIESVNVNMEVDGIRLVNSRITAEDARVDGKRVEGTADGRYLYYTLDNDSLYDLYHEETEMWEKVGDEWVKIEKKDQNQNKDQDPELGIKRPAGPARQEVKTPDITAFREEERRLYLDLWELSEGTHRVVMRYSGDFLNLLHTESIHVMIEFEISAAS